MHHRSNGFFRILFRATLLIVLAAAAVQLARTASAQADAPAAAGDQGGAGVASAINISHLFRESFDFFTVLLLICSLVGWTYFFLCAFEIRAGKVLAPLSEEIIRECIGKNAWAELRSFLDEDRSFLSATLRPALRQPGDSKDSVRNAAELAASEECARLFRLVEPLNIVGNLGPLLGLAGTVWGMVIAFAALGQTGGQANPASLSLGISKALFHTLLGLLVALPALASFGYFRGRADRLCNRAMIVAADLVEMLPAPMAIRMGGNAPGARPAAAATTSTMRPGAAAAPNAPERN